ncbi:MAG TPA: hypothetical protein VIL97_08205 [Thermoanaerobaculia bacterium]
MTRFRAPRRNKKNSERPSLFFVLALLLGLILLGWGAVMYLRTPIPP